MKNYQERLKTIVKGYQAQNVDFCDVSPLFVDFTASGADVYNWIWKKSIKPYLEAFKGRKAKKGDFKKDLFSKAIFNMLYGIRQDKNDAIFQGMNKESDLYKRLASHQYVRRELEKMGIDEIIFISYGLAGTIKAKKERRGAHA